MLLMSRPNVRRREKGRLHLRLGLYGTDTFSCVCKCLLTFSRSPFKLQSSKSCYNYEPCLPFPANSIKKNGRAGSAVMGLSIGRQPWSDTLCVCLCSGYVSMTIRLRPNAASYVLESKDVWKWWMERHFVCFAPSSLSLNVCVCVCSECVDAADEGLKEPSVKLPHSLSPIKCVTHLIDEFWTSNF